MSHRRVGVSTGFTQRTGVGLRVGKEERRRVDRHRGAELSGLLGAVAVECVCWLRGAGPRTSFARWG